MPKIEPGACQVKHIGIGESNDTQKLKAACPCFLLPQASNCQQIILMKKNAGNPC